MSVEIDPRDIEVLSREDPVAIDEPVSMVGGSAIPEPVDQEQVAAAVDGSVAARLRAVGEKLQQSSTRDFPIVVRDENDEPFATIVLRARAFRDRKAYRAGLKTEAFIVRATAGLFLRDEDTDELLAIPTWGTELAAMLGVRAENASDLVRRVLDNPVRLETFGGELVQWMAGRSQQLEQSLGE